ncbi:hypothetical protein BFW01_g1707 [Lasiodiplodia theobromae]|nr:hypothetical protein BFW01_g1707 [Lasiodiplodia theobromae]
MNRKTPMQYLSLPNLQWAIKPGITPSTHDSDVVIDGWEPMTDFTRDNIESLLGHILGRTYDFPPNLMPVERAHLLIRNEDCLDFAVISWNVEIVNTVVRVMTKELPEPGAYLLWSKGAAAHIDGGLTPDWSAVESTDLQFTRPGWIAGDSKMFPEGFPKRSDGEADHRKARACIEQVLNYASRWNTRYAYLITPYELVIRGKLDPTTQRQFTTRALGQLPLPATPSAASRQGLSNIYAPQRTPTSSIARTSWTPPHQQQRPLAVTPTSARSSLSTAADSDRTYQQSPGGERRARMMSAEVAVIPWHSDDSNGFSVNLAMLAIHVLAKIKNSLEESYPPIHEDPAYRGALGLD